MRPLLLVVAAALTLAVPTGHAAKPSFGFRATAPRRVPVGTTAVVLAVRSSEPAQVTATLYRSGRKLETWHRSVVTGPGRLRLRLGSSSRRVGRYTVLVVARAGTQTVFRTLRFRIS